LDLEEGKQIGVQFEMLRITLERILEIDEDCVLVSCTGRRPN
jgi:hypothetical protein